MEEFEQMGLFEATYEPFAIKNKIRLIELFGGIGSQAKALEVLGADFEHWRLVEWATNSILAYNAIHIKDWGDHSEGLSKTDLLGKLRGISSNYNKPMTDQEILKRGEPWMRRIYSSMYAEHNLTPDISNVHSADLGIRERERYTYIMTYSFPCQDLSQAGKMKMMGRDSGTRSGLLWQVERILYECKDNDSLPQVLIMENVPQVCGVKNASDWQSWLSSLERMGYTNYPKLINAKNYGIPQNRLRCFMVSLLGEKSYTYPKKVKLRYAIKHFLDEKVDERFFLSDKMIDCFIRYSKKNKDKGNGFEFSVKAGGAIANAITTRSGSRGTDNYVLGEPLASVDEHNKSLNCDPKIAVKGKRQMKDKCEEMGVIKNPKFNDMTSRVYSPEGLCPTIRTVSGGGGEIKIGTICLNPKVDGKQPSLGDRIYSIDGCMPAVATAPFFNANVIEGENMTNNLRIRKLTDGENMRLMGFEQADTEAMKEAGLSVSTIFHSAGDSIVTTDLIGIMGMLIGADTTKAIDDYVDKLTHEKGGLGKYYD